MTLENFYRSRPGLKNCWVYVNHSYLYIVVFLSCSDSDETCSLLKFNIFENRVEKNAQPDLDTYYDSCIDVYSYNCLHPLSNERKSMFKSGDSHAVRT